MKVAIVGAGWAGLSAALALHRMGHAVHIFEAAHQAGGRARRVQVRGPQGPADADNGQHILLGAYTETLALMQSLGCDPQQQFVRMPLTIESADGSLRLRAPGWPAPWHLAAALLGAQGLRLKERLYSALPLLMPPQGANHHSGQAEPAGETVRQWLMRCRQSAWMQRMLWEPLCLAALNTPMDQACAHMFYTVLRDSLTGSASNSHMLIPRSDLTQLWPHAAVEQLQAGTANRVLFGHTVRELEPLTRSFDAVILATPPTSAHRLLASLGTPTAEHTAWLQHLTSFQFLPIATLTLYLDHPWSDPAPMLMLDSAKAPHHFGQWLFNHAHLHPQWKNRLTVVVSDARALMQSSEADVVNGIREQIEQQTAARTVPLPPITGHTLITEKRATFAATPGLWRPPNRSPWPGIWVAGDWTHTRYPAVLEGAVRSGLTAAQQLNESWHSIERKSAEPKAQERKA